MVQAATFESATFKAAKFDEAMALAAEEEPTHGSSASWVAHNIARPGDPRPLRSLPVLDALQQSEPEIQSLRPPHGL